MKTLAVDPRAAFVDVGSATGRHERPGRGARHRRRRALARDHGADVRRTRPDATAHAHAHTHSGVLQIVGEVGTDLTQWPTEKHFTAWAGLAPGNHDSGKRKGRVKRGRNRTGQLFCMMAQSLVRSKDIALGGCYRRMAARRGGLIATMALARKLAAWDWRVMVKDDYCVENDLADCDAQVLKTQQRALKRLTKDLGQQLVPIVNAA